MNHIQQPPTPEAARRHLLELKDAFDTFRQNREIPLDSLIWPNGLNRGILSMLPLKVRTRNCLRAAKLMDGDGAITAKHLLRLRNFGKNSLEDLIYSIEEFLIECAKKESNDNERSKNSRALLRAPWNVREPVPWEPIGELLNPILAAAAELYDKKTLADTLSPEIVYLANRMGMGDRIKKITIEDVINDIPTPTQLTFSRLEQVFENMSDTNRTIVKHRLLLSPPSTLEEVSVLVGVTRERVRQIQKELDDQISSAMKSSISFIALTLKEQFDEVTIQKRVDQKIAKLLPEKQSPFTEFFVRKLLQEMDFLLEDGVYFDRQAYSFLATFRDIAHRISDDVGLIDKDALRATLPNENWIAFWPWLLTHFRFFDLYGQIAIRDSAKAKTKAALLFIGRPATRAEIAGICGIQKNQVGNYLSNIESVVRADKERWGLKDWIDDEYNGIVKEIVQRIREDGGSTSVERLLTELPSSFGVNPNSVKAYLMTQKFHVQDGWVKLESRSKIQLRDLDDVIDGRDDANCPYWTFVVKARFFDGFSIQGVPPEIANALGCRPDDMEKVEIENLPECPPLSISWPLSSPAGASIGNLASPLKLLEIRADQRVRVTIKDRSLVRLDPDNGNSVDTRSSAPEAILARILQRRKVF